jgi:hypothetical protein
MFQKARVAPHIGLLEDIYLAHVYSDGSFPLIVALYREFIVL